MNGNNMFPNTVNLNTTYTPNPFQPNYPQFQNCVAATPAHPNKPYEILSPDRQNVLGYFWYYGNSVELIFDVGDDSEYGYISENGYLYNSEGQIEGPKPVAILIEDLLPTLKLEATIYDFRHEPIIIFSNDYLVSKNEIKIDKNILTLSITNELSSKLIKGRYCLELKATHPDGYNETLFSSEMNNLIFEVR